MITINQSPLLNSILLDANDTLISITSDNGVGYYFRAVISIDNVFFDEQSWSRKDAYTCDKIIKKLYNAYFETIYSSAFVNGLNEQTHLIRKVSIVVNEYSIGNDLLTSSINIPDFYIMYNVKPVMFLDSVKLQFLSVLSDIIQISNTGKISIPFYINASNENILVELKDNNNNLIDTVTIPGVIGKKVYLYNYDLSTSALVNILNATLKVYVGAVTISKTFRIFNLPKYPVKEILYLNNFGYWIYAYLDGQLTIENNLDVKTYEEKDFTEKIYEIDEKQTYTLSSGSLISNEKEILNEIVTSLSSKINLNNEILDMNTSTKKILRYKDRNNLYSENLTFNVQKNNSVLNPLNLNSIQINSITQNGDPNYDLVYTANFIPDTITAEHSLDGITFDPLDSFTMVIGTSPAAIEEDSGTYHFYYRLHATYNGADIYSDIYEYPVFVAPSLVSANRNTSTNKVTFIWNTNGINYGSGTAMLQYSIDNGNNWVTSAMGNPMNTIWLSNVIPATTGTPIWYRIVLYGNGYSDGKISNVIQTTF